MDKHSFEGVKERYRQRVSSYQLEEDRLLVSDRWLTQIRVAVFLLCVVTIGFGFVSGAGRPAYAAAGAIFLGFVALVGWHDRIARRLAEERILRRMCEQGLARMERRWDELPVWEFSLPRESIALANDLDLFGRASLFQLLCTAGTSIGRQTLRDWLLEPAAPEEIELRQQSVRELSEHDEIRERLNLLGRLLHEGKTGPLKFIAWAEDVGWLEKRKWLHAIAVGSPITILIAILGIATGFLAPQVGGVAILAMLLVNALISVIFTGDAHQIFVTVSSRNGEASKYLDMFSLLHAVSLDSSKLVELQAQLRGEHGGVLARLSQLMRIMWCANLSHSPMFFILVYVPLQMITLWDFHVLARLETWQKHNRSLVREWFHVLGEFEALTGLATLSYEHPDWTFPVVHRESDRFDATELGHPLLPEESRVVNDVELGPPRTFLLVTGSNMSGKSTLLRSIGTNVVLAQAGAPVCAKSLTMPSVEVATSMRIHDSLADGVSFFMAELKRLKEVVDLAHEYSQKSDRRLLYLLDEILQGTNSRERHIAVERVLKHLLDCDAIGAISTHDLELAASGPLSEACRPVHFREQLDRESDRQMTFDYVMRDGVATTTNALKLLSMVGLD